MFESYLAPAGATPHRDLGAAEIWQVSLQRSLRRRALAERQRRAAPRTKGTAAAVGAALLVAPLLPFASATAQDRGAAQSAPAQPRPRHVDGTILQRGDVNNTVKRIQRALGVADDGMFGPITRRAVADLQTRSRLPRTGKVDGRTWRALFSSSSAASVGPRTGGAQVGAAPKPRAAAAPATAACGPFTAPVAGLKTSGFGGARNHAGIDIAAPVGTAVRAAACGRVTLAGAGQEGYGTMICIEHSAALQTCYAHLSKTSVAQGATVAAGQLIGRVGMTGRTSGPHLHFETRVGGQAHDPAPYLAGTPIP